MVQKLRLALFLITTKSGAQTDKFEVSYSNNFSWQDPAKSIEIGGIEALQYTLDAQINRGEPMPAGGFWRISPESLEKAIEWQKQYGGKVKWNDPVVYGRDWYYDGKDKYGYRLYDAAKAMVRNWAPTMSHNLSVNGKSGKTSYNIGLGYLDQSGMSKTAKKDDFKRYNASVSVTSELNKYLTVRASSIYSDRNKRYPGIGNTSADPWLYMYRWSPLFPMGVTEHGNPLKEPSYEMAASNTDNLQNKYYNVNLGFTLNITKNWDVKFDYTYDRQTSETNSSVTQYEAGATWYAPTAWIENGSQVFVNEQLLERGAILRSPQKLQSFADYVDTKIGTAHSRWMIAPGPWMPFSMVKLSPDNQNKGWQAGYQPTFETLGCFSHIHEWTMGGLGMMPTNGKLFTKVGDQFRPDEGYRSRIDKKTEEAPLGYYKVFLTDTEILAEVTATERASFQKYTFPKDKDGRVMIDLHIQAEYDYNLLDVDVRKVSDYRIEGRSHQISPRPHVWSDDADQEYVVNFVIEFDAPIKR